MKTTDLTLDSVLAVSGGVVSREVSDEFFLLPISEGVGDLETELFKLDETGKEIWTRLNGQRSLTAVVENLLQEYNANRPEIEEDVLGLAKELHQRGLADIVS